MQYVYLLRLASSEPYVGSTGDLRKRLAEHQEGKNISTKHSLPCRLIAYVGFRERILAFRFERYLKSGSGRAFRKRHFGM